MRTSPGILFKQEFFSISEKPVRGFYLVLKLIPVFEFNPCLKLSGTLSFVEFGIQPKLNCYFSALIFKMDWI